MNNSSILLLLLTVPTFSTPQSPITALVSSGHKQQGLSKPIIASVKFTLPDNSSFETQGHIINTTRKGHTIVINLKESPTDRKANMQEKLRLALRPTTDYIIVEGDGTIITKVGIVQGSQTATPGHIRYSNYLGSQTVPSKKTNTKAGERQRIDFCKGACKVKRIE